MKDAKEDALLSALYDDDEQDSSLNSSSGGGALARAPAWPPPSLADSDSQLAALRDALPSDLAFGLKNSIFFLLACWQVISWTVALFASKRYFDGCQLAPGNNVSLAGDARLYLAGQPLPLPFCISCFNGTRVSTFVPPSLINNFTESAAQYSPITVYYDPSEECKLHPSFSSCFFNNIYSSTSALLVIILIVSLVKLQVQAPAAYLLGFGVRVRSSKQQLWAGLGFTLVTVVAIFINSFNQNRESGKAGADTVYACKDVLGFVVPQGKVVSIQATYLADNPTAPADAFTDSADIARIFVALVQILLLYKDFILDTLALLSPLAGLDLMFVVDASSPGAAAAIAGVHWRVCPVQLFQQWTLLKFQLHRKGWMSAAGELTCELPQREPNHCSLLLCLQPCVRVLFNPPLGTRRAHAWPLPAARGLSLTHFLLLRMQSKGLLEANVPDAGLQERLRGACCPCLRGGRAHHHDRGTVVPLEGVALDFDEWLRSEGRDFFLEKGFWRQGSVKSQ